MGNSGLGEGARRLRAQDPGDVAMHLYQPRGLVWSIGSLVPYMFDRPRQPAMLWDYWRAVEAREELRALCEELARRCA